MEQVDIVLIGGGIMSATLGVLLKDLRPDATIALFERLDRVGAESSDAWNNAGTGHSAFCELNYTPPAEDGSVPITKAVSIAKAFEVARQLWAAWARRGVLDPSTFLHSVPHLSFVRTADDVAFLRKRYDALTAHPLFAGMQWSDDPEQLAAWMPRMMEGRDPAQVVAATYMEAGTDVDFGALTRALITHMEASPGTDVHLQHEVTGLNKVDGRWIVEVRDAQTHAVRAVSAGFVFVGAGGGALHLLQSCDLPEAQGYGGFPVSGIWLRCTNPEVIAAHHAKVYGMPPVGAPPMSVPHLDTRVINGEKALLFGPFAGFSTKFLKEGSLFDLPFSLDLDNLFPVLSAGMHNVPLTAYLIGQLLQTTGDRMDALHDFYPYAVVDDWELCVAGQRVQVIRPDAEQGGVLQFGTELIVAADHSLAALLGASPGASSAGALMIDVVERCFPELAGGLASLVPWRGEALIARVAEVRAETARVLGLVA